MQAATGDTEVVRRLSQIRHKILVLSGKGGVGKSTVAVALAEALVEKGYHVGLLDIDLCGPSVPHMVGVQGKSVMQAADGVVPVYVNDNPRFAVMSMGFLLPSDTDAVIWRGPKKHAMIRQFITDVRWGALDYLIIDSPPGTSDEHITICECLRMSGTVDGAVMVTTPQDVAVADVRRELTFCQKVKIPVLGIVENMSGFVCPHCSECSDLFGEGGGQKLAEAAGVPLLARVPLDPQMSVGTGTGLGRGPAATALRSVADRIVSASTAKQ